MVADLQGDGQTGLWLRGSLPAMWQMFCPGLLLAVAPHLRADRARRWLVELGGARRPVTALVLALAVLVPAAVLGAAAPLRYGVVDYQLLTDASRPLFAVGYGLILAVAIAAPPWHARWPLALGLASYGIYLLHPVVADLLTRLGLVPVAHDTLLAFVVNTLVLALLTVPLALASWHWLERPLVELASSRAPRVRHRDRGADRCPLIGSRPRTRSRCAASGTPGRARTPSTSSTRASPTARPSPSASGTPSRWSTTCSAGWAWSSTPPG